MKSVIWGDLLTTPQTTMDEEKPERSKRDLRWDGYWIATASVCAGLVLFAIAMIHG